MKMPDMRVQNMDLCLLNIKFMKIFSLTTGLSLDSDTIDVNSSKASALYKSREGLIIH